MTTFEERGGPCGLCVDVARCRLPEHRPERLAIALVTGWWDHDASKQEEPNDRRDLERRVAALLRGVTLPEEQGLVSDLMRRLRLAMSIFQGIERHYPGAAIKRFLDEKMP